MSNAALAVAERWGLQRRDLVTQLGGWILLLWEFRGTPTKLVCTCWSLPVFIRHARGLQRSPAGGLSGNAAGSHAAYKMTSAALPTWLPSPESLWRHCSSRFAHELLLVFVPPPPRWGIGLPSGHYHAFRSKRLLTHEESVTSNGVKASCTHLDRLDATLALKSG